MATRRLLKLGLFVCLWASLEPAALTFDVPCPSRAASGRIEAGQVQLIFHSPKSGRDISLDYDGANWASQSSRASLAKLASRGFNLSAANVIYMHAYTQSSSSAWLQEVRRHYRQDGYAGQLNLMFYDWSYFSRQRYDSAASWTPKLGLLLAKLLLQLELELKSEQQQEANPSNSSMMSRTHLVAYSLSTHIAGQAGRYLAARGRPLARITALDPTGVCFHQEGSPFGSQYALRASDAKLVLSRHYDMGSLGASRPVGGLDVFVNGGKNQPAPARSSRGASQLWPIVAAFGFRASSHMMASLNEVQDRPDDCRDVAYACSSYRAFLAGECADCGRNNANCIDLNTMEASRLHSLTSPANYRAGTSMFIKTSQESSCIHHYQAVLRLKSNPSAGQRRLLEDELSFVFVDQLGRNNQRAKVSHKPKGQSGALTYVALLTTGNGQLASSKQIKLQLQSSADASNRRQERDQDQEMMSNLSKLIDALELNYMSNDRAQERALKSAKFCPSATGRDYGTLLKCA